MSRKKTLEEFNKELYNLYGDLYSCLSTNYINNKTKMLIQCNKCGRTWEIIPNSILRGHGCPWCNGKSFLDDLTGKKFGKLTVLYKNKSKGIDHKTNWHCKCDCGNETDVNSSSLKAGKTQSCGHCGYVAYINGTHVPDMTGMIIDNIKVLSYDSLTDDNSALWLCEDINTHEQRIIRGSDLRSHKYLGFSCNSKGEAKIESILKQNNIQYFKQQTFNDLFNINKTAKLRFDFYIPLENLAIEYDGEGHFEQVANWDLNTQQINDKLKNEYCFNHNITLIRIPYTHYDDLTIDDLKINTTKFICKGGNDERS